MNLSKQGIERIRRGLIRSWQPGGTHRLNQQATRIDADTSRSRAKADRKGKLAVSGIDIYHSTQRSDQFDVFVKGKLVVTGGPRVIAEWLVSTKQT